jgi:predicted nucleic acid-binding protein
MIIVDSNTWIFAENINSEEHDIAAQKLKTLFANDSFGINVIITSEVFHILSRLLSPQEASIRVTNILEHPLSQWLDFTSDVVVDAIKLSRERKIRINDALIAQQALKMKAVILTDNLKDFEKVNGLKIIPLR